MRIRAALIVTGVLIIAYAVLGALADPDVRPGGVLLFLAAVLVGHDAIWMPALLAVLALIARCAPRRYRPVVRLSAGATLLTRAWHAATATATGSRKKSESPDEGGADRVDR